MSRRVYENNFLIEEWSDATRTYTDFRPIPDFVRPYTAEENAAADVRAADKTASDASTALRVTVTQIIADLQAEKDRYQTVIDNVNATAREKDLARAGKRVADATIDLARFVKDK